MLRYNLRYQLFLAVSDAVLVILALALSSVLRINIDIGMEAPLTNFLIPPLLYPITVIIWLFAFGQTHVYAAHSTTSVGRVLRRVFAGHTLACLIFLGALYVTFRDFSRLQAVYFMVLLLVFIMLHRMILNPVRSRLRQYINTQRTVLVVGLSESARRIGSLVAENADAGLNFAGYVRAFDDTESDERVLGSVDDLPQIVKEHNVSEVVIALKWFDQQASDLVSRIMRLLEHYPVNVRIAPDYSELAYFHAKPEDFQGVTLVGLRETVLSPAERIFKRLFDIVFSLAALVVTAPLFLIIAVAIRLDSPGPVIFRQLRIGQHGRRFVIYKFRSMHVNADRIITREEAAKFVKQPDDPRVTRVGAFLRRTSLDELPQFINVLKGDMSVVGPRPEVTWLAEHYEWWQRKRFEVPQGITGWWQVNGRADKPMRLNIEDDLFYVRNYSIWLDLQIILRTVVTWITGKGAY
jgi:exopolysaccharide biosynthesis polyprenyl glycosylphosphotransferase